MFEFLGNLLGGFGEAVLNIFNGVAMGFVKFLTHIVDSLGGFTDVLDGFKDGLGGLYSGFLDLVGVVFPFVPQEWVNILVTCFLITIVGIIVKKKVFD